MTILGDTVRQPTEVRLVGSDACSPFSSSWQKFLMERALNDMVAQWRAETYCHRALASLCKAGLADKDAVATTCSATNFCAWHLSITKLSPTTFGCNQFLPDSQLVLERPRTLPVLDGHDIVYRAKVDPAFGAMRLTSTVGGRNPATQLRLASCSFLSNCRMSKR